MSQALPDDRPDLPQLRSGIQLLAGEDRLTGPVQTLVLDHLLRTGGHAVWLDAAGHAVTHQLARLAPSDRLLDRVQVACGFTHTPYFTRAWMNSTGHQRNILTRDWTDTGIGVYFGEGEDGHVRAYATQNFCRSRVGQ